MFRPRTSSLLAAPLSLCLLFSQLPRVDAAEAPDSTIIARVGDTEVTASDIRSAIQTLDAKTQAAAASDPSSLSQVVRVILTQRLILKVAKENKWDQNPAVTAAVNRLRDNAIVETYLQSVSLPPQTYPSEAEIQTAYDANKNQLIVPRQYHLDQIYVKNIKGADPAVASKAQVKLDGVRKALAKHDADFGAIARAESDDPNSASNDGDLGWLPLSKIQPEIASQLNSLDKGAVSQPLRLDDGWHILKIVDIKEPYTPSLEEIKPQLIQEMRSERLRANTQQYIAKLLQDNPVQIDELNLAKVLKQP